MNAELIDHIYEAPLAATPWLDFLHAYRNILGSHSAQLMFRRSQGTRPAHIDEWDPRFNERRNAYYREFYDLNPIRYDAMEIGHTYVLKDFLSTQDGCAKEFYEGFCRASGVDHALALYLGDIAGVRVWLNTARDRSHPNFTSKERRLTEDLTPHLKRALRVHSVLQQSRAEVEGYREAADECRTGTILLGPDREILGMNGVAEDIISQHPCLGVTNQRLTFRGKVEERHFASMFEELSTDAVEPRFRVVHSCRCPVHRMPLLLRRSHHALDAADRSPSIVVYLKDQLRPLDLDADLVARIFGLTATEAKLGVLLANGLVLRDAAESLGLTEETARTYCKRIFSKTGTNRQTQLVCLFLNSVSTLAH